MHRSSTGNTHDPQDAGGVHAVYSSKDGERFFHGWCASRAEAMNLARRITLPPHGHDLAVVRRLPAGVAPGDPGRGCGRPRPVLATIDGRTVGSQGAASGTG
jgi:hypothetical protein